MEPAATVPDAPVLSAGERRKLKGKNHKCPSCELVFKEAREARSHNEGVHLGVTYTCVTCAKVYTNKVAFKHHQKQVEISGISCKEPNKTIFCKICHKGHKDPVKRHEQGARHRKSVKKALKSASEREKARKEQILYHERNLKNLSTLTGTALRVAIMQDDEVVADSESEEDWTGYGGDSE